MIEPEQRMIMAAILLSVAQQKASNVKWLGVSPSKVEHLSEVIAEEARLFVASDGFVEMCEAVGTSAQFMREKNPDQALKLYKIIMSDSWSKQ